MKELITITPEVAEISTKPTIAEIVATAIQTTVETAKSDINYDLFCFWADTLTGNEKTKAQYRKQVFYFISYLETNGIARPTTLTVEQYQDFLLDSKTPKTVASYISALSKFFTWADNYNIYPNIVKAVKRVKVDNTEFRHDYFELEEVMQMLNTFDTSTVKGARDYAITLLMAVAGLRTIEVVSALIKDITKHGTERRLYVMGKGDAGHSTYTADKSDFVKLPDLVYNAIQHYLDLRQPKTNSEPLFTNLSRATAQGTTPAMTTRSIRRLAKATFAEIGITDDKHTAHSLRHTTATLLIQNGCTLEQVQQVLRHTSSATTKIYTHATTRANNHSEQILADALSSIMPTAEG